MGTGKFWSFVKCAACSDEILYQPILGIPNCSRLQNAILLPRSGNDHREGPRPLLCPIFGLIRQIGGEDHARVSRAIERDVPQRVERGQAEGEIHPGEQQTSLPRLPPATKHLVLPGRRTVANRLLAA